MIRISQRDNSIDEIDELLRQDQSLRNAIAEEVFIPYFKLHPEDDPEKTNKEFRPSPENKDFNALWEKFEKNHPTYDSDFQEQEKKNKLVLDRSKQIISTTPRDELKSNPEFSKKLWTILQHLPVDEESLKFKKQTLKPIWKDVFGINSQEYKLFMDRLNNQIREMK